MATWVIPSPKNKIIGDYFKKNDGKSTNNSYVYTAIHKRSHKNVLLKFIPLQGQDEQIDRECSIQQAVEHEYIMPLQEIFVYSEANKNEYRVLVMDLAKGSIENAFLDGYFNNILQIYRAMYQITKGVGYLHDHFILHGDINPKNVVVMDYDDYMPSPRIIDFGHAQTLVPDQDGNYFCTCNRYTPRFSAPEILKRQPHSFSSDIYSLGATFYYMITKKAPPKEGQPLLFGGANGNNLPQSGQDLIKKMLDLNPLSRPTLKQVLESDFFKETVLNDEEWVKKEEEFAKKAVENMKVSSAFDVNVE